MGAIATRTGTIGLLDSGGGDATPIVFLHGVGSVKSVWAPQIDHFARQRRAVAFDYPGYGDSSFRPGATRDDLAAAMLAAMDALAIDRAHVCGLSLGGVVAIAMHHAAPDRCASLILADSFSVHPNGQAIYDRSIEASRSIGMRALAEGRVDALVGVAASSTLRAEIVATMAAIDPAAYALGAAAVWLADQRDRVAAIDAPCLILCGAEDQITPPELSRELAAQITGASLEIIDGAGHLANAEQPEAFNAAIDRFLAEID